MKKNKILFPKKVALLLGAAAVLLLGSTVGSTRAALTYYSENYSAQMNLKHIGVSLVENGQVVSSRVMFPAMSGAAIQRASFWPICLVRKRSLHRANSMMKPSA